MYLSGYPPVINMASWESQQTILLADFPAMLAESIHIPWGAKELGSNLAHVRHVTTLSRPYWHLH